MSANETTFYQLRLYSLTVRNSTVLITPLIEVSNTLSYKDVEVISVSLTEDLLPAESLTKTAFPRCFLLV